MKRWLLFAMMIVATGCATPTGPTPPPFTAPTVLIATVVPIPTLLPTVTTEAPAAPTLEPPTATSIPTATRRAAAPTRAAANRFAAPVPVSPDARSRFRDGNDIEFVFKSVGRLEPNQCYLHHVELAVPNLAKGNRGDDFLDLEHCGDAGPEGKELTFVLYRGRFTNSPNYGTILTQTHELAPEARELKMTWTVRVVQNNGRAADGVHFNTVALSPNSPVNEFAFQP